MFSTKLVWYLVEFADHILFSFRAGSQEAIILSVVGTVVALLVADVRVNLLEIFRGASRVHRIINLKCYSNFDIKKHIIRKQCWKIKIDFFTVETYWIFLSTKYFWRVTAYHGGRRCDGSRSGRYLNSMFEIWNDFDATWLSETILLHVKNDLLLIELSNNTFFHVKPRFIFVSVVRFVVDHVPPRNKQHSVRT